MFSKSSVRILYYIVLCSMCLFFLSCQSWKQVNEINVYIYTFLWQFEVLKCSSYIIIFFSHPTFQLEVWAKIKKCIKQKKRDWEIMSSLFLLLLPPALMGFKTFFQILLEISFFLSWQHLPVKIKKLHIFSETEKAAVATGNSTIIISREKAAGLKLSHFHREI